MSSFGSVKEGWLTKQGGERKNWKKRWFLLQDNILYYFADQKDEFSKGSIPLGKVTQIQRHEHKKKFIFEIHTTVEGRVFYILAESEAVMKDWMDAITTTWMLHTMKDKYKEKFYHGADNYMHTLINMAKRVFTTVVRMTGVTKAVIHGGGRAHKAKPAEATTIYADNAELGASVLEIGRQVLATEKDPYKYELRKNLERVVGTAAKLAEMIGGRGAGSVNEGACTSTSRQLVTEITNMVAQTYPPSMKTNILYLVHLHASVIEKFSTATNSDLKANESKRLEELGKAFPIIAKEVFPHMPDLTYAQPLLDGCHLVPRVTYDVRELVKTAAVFTAGETYATNSCKTLFYLLNDIRRNAMSGFPPSPYDDKFPQVGPPDAQFQLSSAEFASNIADAGSSAGPGDTSLAADSVPQLSADLLFDDLNGIPPPPPEEDHPLMASCGPMDMSFSSLGSSDPGMDGWDQLSSSTGMTMPINASLLAQRNVAFANGNGGMAIGSAPATLNFNAAMMRPNGALSSSQGPGSSKIAMINAQPPVPIAFGGPSVPAPNSPVMPGRYGSPGTNPAPGSVHPASLTPLHAPAPNTPAPVGRYAAPGTNPTPGSFNPASAAPVAAPLSGSGSFSIPPTTGPGSAKFTPPTPKSAPGTPGSGKFAVMLTPPGTPPPAVLGKTPTPPPTGTPPFGTPPAQVQLPKVAPKTPGFPPPQQAAPGSLKQVFVGPPKQPVQAPQQPPVPQNTMTPEQMAYMQQQQLIIQQQQQQILWQQQQQQLLLQQQQQEALIKQQQEELARQQAAAEELRKAEEAKAAEESKLAAEQAKQASALDELSKLEWNI
jgi:hypothetical protein